MQILLTLSSITFLILIVGREMFPSILGNFYVFWGLNLSLVIMLAIGFAKSLSIYFQGDQKTINTFSNAAWYLLLFLSVLIIPITVHYGMNSLNNFNFSYDRGLSIKDTSSCETEESRKFMAGFLFGQYGIKIPYRLDSGDYKVFQPTEEQIKEYTAKFEEQKEINELELQLSNLAWSSFRLAIIQAVLFFVVFVGTVLFEQKQLNIKKANQLINTDH